MKNQKNILSLGNSNEKLFKTSKSRIFPIFGPKKGVDFKFFCDWVRIEAYL